MMVFIRILIAVAVFLFVFLIDTSREAPIHQAWYTLLFVLICLLFGKGPPTKPLLRLLRQTLARKSKGKKKSKKLNSVLRDSPE